MKVVSIRSKMLFNFYDPRAEELVPEGVKFLAGAVLTFWTPPLMFCYVVGQASPFYFMIFCEALGALLGLLIYKRPWDAPTPDSPDDKVYDVRSGLRLTGEYAA